LSLDYRSIKEYAQVPHIHDADDAYCQRRYLLWRIKVTAKSSGETTSTVVVFQVKDVSADVQAELPKFHSLEQTAGRARIVAGSRRFVVSARSELPLLNGIFFSPSNEDIVKWDSGRSNDRIVIFSTDANLDTLGRSEHWFADGTFKSCPILFDQLFILHGYKTDGENVICLPLAYVVTPNRTAVTYKRIFEQLKTLQPGLAPNSIMTDYESALLKSFTEAFPTTERRGCFFHFRQAVRRKISRKSFSSSILK